MSSCCDTTLSPVAQGAPVWLRPLGDAHTVLRPNINHPETPLPALPRPLSPQMLSMSHILRAFSISQCFEKHVLVAFLGLRARLSLLATTSHSRPVNGSASGPDRGTRGTLARSPHPLPHLAGPWTLTRPRSSELSMSWHRNFRSCSTVLMWDQLCWVMAPAHGQVVAVTCRRSGDSEQAAGRREEAGPEGQPAPPCGGNKPFSLEREPPRPKSGDPPRKGSQASSPAGQNAKGAFSGSKPGSFLPILKEFRRSREV